MLNDGGPGIVPGIYVKEVAGLPVPTPFFALKLITYEDPFVNPVSVKVRILDANGNGPAELEPLIVYVYV